MVVGSHRFFNNMQPKGKVTSIFPTAVGFYDLDRDLTKTEQDVIIGADRVKNFFNSKSKDTRILDRPILKDLRKWLQSCVDNYFENIYCPKYKVNLSLTQSWCNFTENNQHHHKHLHSNSFISGVFYVQVDESVDKIYFHNETYRQLDVAVREYNSFNSKSWWFPCIEKQLILFPSSCFHMVENRKPSAKTRISLSFNTFPHGHLGEVDELTQVSI